MKKPISIIMACMLAICCFAAPAKPGCWHTLKLSDGSEVKALLTGDEHLHYWVTEQGTLYVERDDTYVTTTESELRQKLSYSRRTRTALARQQRQKKAPIGQRTHYTGKKQGIVILVEFTDVKFQKANNKQRYQRILNEQGYSEGNFRGSVADYFKEQSAGQFELQFDIVGPYTLQYDQAYYGNNDQQGNDMHPDEMVIEACHLADGEVNFADYDWDGDGEADQVFILYAGKGEADSQMRKSVWPHMARLNIDFGKTLTLDNTSINTYACSNEIDSSGNIEGIGCFCHEFSHCMGIPDFYDILYSGQFGMSSFDLMCQGSYNGNGFLPAGYTAHEKMMCGWKEPIVLANEDVSVEGLLPMSQNGDTYIIYNDAHPDEYFMVENRQKTGFDQGYPAKGLLITHVDFDKEVWENNIPNSIVSKETARLLGYTTTNDHQRMTLLHADNDDDSEYWNSYSGYYTRRTIATDLYPYLRNDSLTPTSKPAPALFNRNKKGTKTTEWGIVNIRQNSDGTMGFDYVAKAASQAGDGNNDDDDPVITGDELFYESFDKCQNKGGNDGMWTGQIATGELITDNEGWVTQGGKAYGANKCAKFGTGSTEGRTTTPPFTIDGEATLLFKAAAWNTQQEDSIIYLMASDGFTISPQQLKVGKGQWTQCEATLKGTGTATVTFALEKRFFLDEVRVVDGAITPSAIHTATLTQQRPQANATFDLQGRRLSEGQLPKGIYIKNGKKIIVK